MSIAPASIRAVRALMKVDGAVEICPTSLVSQHSIMSAFVEDTTVDGPVPYRRLRLVWNPEK